MSDDFFGELDKKLAVAKDEKAAKAAQEDEARAYSRDAIEAMRRVAKDYAAKLRERKITAQVGGSDGLLKFEMMWGNGDTHGLEVVPDFDTGRIKLLRNSTDHSTGKPFRSTDGRLYDQSSWQPSIFESALTAVIDDYVSLADKHRGIA